MYTIVDIETTGGNAHFGKITEIAIFVHDGLQVVDEFITLINPECTIPEFITRLTGISNEMVQGAPKFYEVARRIVEITEGRIFVAHNAAFDYNFIKTEFRRLGYTFQRDTLCTVKASRQLLPNLSSYSLGKLCQQLGIQIENRHRAGGDALATVHLLDILRQQANAGLLSTMVNRTTLPSKINDHLDRKTIDALPETTGVYYFLDGEGQYLYIGKSKNIHDRVVQHLNKPSTKKARELLNRVADIHAVTTGSELIALLLESSEIKKHQPVYNRTQLRNSYRYGIFAELKLDGFIHFQYGKSKGKEPLVACSTEEEARKLLFETSKKHMLCLQKTGLEANSACESPCFHYKLQTCKGACIGKEKPDQYNTRASEAMRTFQYPHPNFVVVGPGRDVEELSVVLVESGRFKGYGYCQSSDGISNIEAIKDCIRTAPDNREVARIIQGYIGGKHNSKVVRF